MFRKFNVHQGSIIKEKEAHYEGLHINELNVQQLIEL